MNEGLFIKKKKEKDNLRRNYSLLLECHDKVPSIIV